MLKCRAKPRWSTRAIDERDLDLIIRLRAVGRPSVSLRILEPDLPEKFPSRYLTYEGEKISLQLPPGDYRLSYYATDCIAANNKAVTVAAHAKEVDLGTIDLAPTVLSQLYGKVPPEWSVSEARGIDRAVRLADFKGKWVLLEFWGFW